mgnify:CR=1 FL=1
MTQLTPKKKGCIKRTMKRATTTILVVLLIAIVVMEPVWAQSLIPRIDSAIRQMVLLLNVLLVGALAWSGFLLAKGDGAGISRLIYCVMALIVVNSAQLILDFFR